MKAKFQRALGKIAVLCVLMMLAVTMVPRAAFAKSESESNDELYLADAVKVGEVMEGVSGPRISDRDFFKIYAPVAGKATLTLTNTRWTDSGSYYRLFTYNEYYEESTGKYMCRCNSTRPFSQAIYLHKGYNYIRIITTNFDVETHPYKFVVRYNVSKPSVKAKAAKKAVTASWGTCTSATSYQVRYSTKKSMAGAKVINVSKSARSRTIKGLKAKKTYYVQVRAVRNVSGKAYYSAWSAQKAVKTK